VLRDHAFDLRWAVGRTAGGDVTTEQELMQAGHWHGEGVLIQQQAKHQFKIV
jgi:hypothetical protein